MKRIHFHIIALLTVALSAVPDLAAQKVVHDREKELQWRSMENGPWEFAPGWYYYFLHKDYSGAYKKWQWRGFKSGYVVKFDENKSNIKRIMPTRVLSEETQRQKLDKTESERAYIEPLYKEEVAREADRMVDVTYSTYKEEFDRMQKCIEDGLLYCMTKSKGKLLYQVQELTRQHGIICQNIAYIHKQGVGYEMENAKRQKAYEEAKVKMQQLVGRTARLAAVAATHDWTLPKITNGNKFVLRDSIISVDIIHNTFK